MTIYNTTFVNTTAKNKTDVISSGIGGAIYFTCNAYNLQCGLNLTSGSIFKNCTSDVKGGAIFWDVLEPSYSSDLKFYNNSAFLYGDDKACYSQMLATVTETQYNNHLIKHGLMEIDYLRNLATNTSGFSVNQTMSNV